MINFFKKISVALCSSVTQEDTVTIDNESLALFQREVAKCESSLQASKRHLARIIANKTVAKRKLDNLRENIANKLEAIQTTRSQHQMDTARQLAAELLALEQWLEDNQQQLKKLKQHEQNALLVLKNTASTLGHYRNELTIAKAQHHDYAAIDSPTMSRESIVTMQQSLRRLKHRHNSSDTVFG